jgi:hypothetical protein
LPDNMRDIGDAFVGIQAAPEPCTADVRLPNELEALLLEKEAVLLDANGHLRRNKVSPLPFCCF